MVLVRGRIASRKRRFDEPAPSHGTGLQSYSESRMLGRSDGVSDEFKRCKTITEHSLIKKPPKLLRQY